MAQYKNEFSNRDYKRYNISTLGESKPFTEVAIKNAINEVRKRNLKRINILNINRFELDIYLDYMSQVNKKDKINHFRSLCLVGFNKKIIIKLWKIN